MDSNTKDGFYSDTKPQIENCMSESKGAYQVPYKLIDQAGLEAKDRCEQRERMYKAGQSIPYDPASQKDYDMLCRYDRLHNCKGQSTRHKTEDGIIS